MKITIDTKEDSHPEIRRAIKLLSSLVEASDSNETIYTNDAESATKPTSIFDDPSPSLSSDDSPQPEESSGNAFASMFGDTPEKPTKTAAEEEPEEHEKEEEEETPQIEIIDY